MIACHKCGEELSLEAKFCSVCGAERMQSVNVSTAEQLKNQIEMLRAELLSVEDAIEFQSFGFYQTRYGFETSADYADRIKSLRGEQKVLVKNKDAMNIPKNWIVDGSLAKGRKMLTEQSQLMLRAFNGECDAVIARTKFDNVAKLEKRLSKAFESINKLGRTKEISISEQYLKQKTEELYLVHEHREKIYLEKEEKRAIREQEMEEKKAQKELEKAQRDAEKEEAKCVDDLKNAKEKLDSATGEQLSKLQELVAKLESELLDAIDRKAKSIARAQLYKSGHVYVLSNLGSFGEGVYKIGMTRRLDPLERVYELGDASVPFRFDVHAMIYTEDAPALETQLHKEFHDRRLNLINQRREYFRVTLEEIHAAVKKYHGEITLVKNHAAEEFRRSTAAREQ